MTDPDVARKRGRPPHRPTPELQARVTKLTAEGSAAGVIAGLIGISEPTLRLHYEAELSQNKPQMALLPADGEALRRTRRAHGGGRPMHVPTAETREQVEVLSAGGMFAWQIAGYLGISEPTLRLHYEQEILIGAARKKGEMFLALFEAGKAGNVSAMKAFLASCREHGANPLEEKPAKQAPVGKKEQQIADARRPNLSTSLGALMAQRLGHRIN